MFSALLDTCVLVPSRARDVLLEIASTGAYRPLWSTEILAELNRTLRLLREKKGASPEETDAYLTRLFRQMETAFPDALVTGWEPLVPAIQLPDPDDRHVVAAASACSRQPQARRTPNMHGSTARTAAASDRAYSQRAKAPTSKTRLTRPGVFAFR
jgi:hypothetical protein